MKTHKFYKLHGIFKYMIVKLLLIKALIFDYVIKVKGHVRSAKF